VDRTELIAFAGDRIGVAETVDYQLGAFRGERPGDGEADARRRSGDQRDFALKNQGRASFAAQSL